LSGGCFTDSLLEVADTLYKCKLYGLARVHGYRRCLVYMGIKASKLGQESQEKKKEEEKREVIKVDNGQEGVKVNMPGLSFQDFVSSHGDEKDVVKAVSLTTIDQFLLHLISFCNAHRYVVR